MIGHLEWSAFHLVFFHYCCKFVYYSRKKISKSFKKLTFKEKENQQPNTIYFPKT